MKLHLKQAFTLIELLVVIAIVAILASIAVPSFLTAQRQARDSNRQKTMLEIQSAFEQYYGEFSAYPTQAAGNLGDAFENGVQPVDPKNSGTYVIDWDQTTVDDYCICSLMETQVGNADAPTSSVCNWNTTNTGGYFCVQNKQ